MIHYTIPLRGLKFSTNKIYAGIHWTQRKFIKDSITSVAGYFCRPIQKVESYPVEIRYRFSFGTRPLDTLNCAAMSKMFEDALRAFEILKDDSPQYVARSILEVIAIPAGKKTARGDEKRSKNHAEDNDRLEITITKI